MTVFVAVMIMVVVSMIFLLTFHHDVKFGRTQIRPHDTRDLEFVVFDRQFLELARALKRSPRAIAEELIVRVGKIDGVERIEPAGAGYINFFLDRAAVVRGSRLHGYPGDDGKIIVEHTNINPNKAAHIGHLRNATIGDTFVRIVKATGRNVEVQNYIDNTGVQVADVIVGLQHVERKTLDDIRRMIANPSQKFDYYCWDVYARVSSFYENDDPKHGLRAQTLKEIE